MVKQVLDWLDHRTGYRALAREALYENIPGGSRWRYVWGSTLVFTFSVQVVTGLFLWMAYSPSARTAWESVYFIQYEMFGGWMLRGIHHFTAQAMVVLLALHLMQVVIDRAYKAPREVNFWLGLILMQIVLGLSLTGYLLPWDQKGYWATKVATNLMGLVPGVGDDIQRVVVGGPNYGHPTLTRFFALHAGLLPALLIIFLVLHVKVFRRHGITAVRPNDRPAQTFWPDQVLKDAVACLAVLAVVLFFVLRGALSGEHAGQRPGEYLGAELGAPADPANPYSAARPEWYFLFLFQFLKYFHGSTEIIGAIVVPGLVMMLLFLMPIIGRWRLGHGFNVGLLFALGCGVITLTTLAIREDRGNADYQAAVETAERNRARAIELARGGIPDTGAVSLLRADPQTRGPELFTRHCASCHAHVPNGAGEVDGLTAIASREPSAPNLYYFGSRRWIAGLLDPAQIAGPNYFGLTKHGKLTDGKPVEGGMIEFVKNDLQKKEEWSAEQIDEVVTALAAEAGVEAFSAEDQALHSKITRGQALIRDEARCAMCHKYHDAGALGTAPDLTGYGSRAWLIGFISDPTHEKFYGKNNDRMPSYAKSPDRPLDNILPRQEIELMADWLRTQWPRPESDAP